jgi:CubicO group peptidase (beta-lactamase class C family)
MTTLSIRQQIGAALCGCALFVTCQAQTVDPADWLPTPEGLRRMADYFPYETVAGGGDVFQLEWGEPLPQVGPDGLDLETFNRDNRSTGMIVLHRGRIVYEDYWLGADAESHFNSWSIAKSVTGTLIGIAEAEGLIESIEDPVVRYVPELAETAYRDVTIEQALQMSSGVRHGETAEDITVSCLALPPGPIFANCDPVRAEFGSLEGLLLSLKERAAPPGTEFQYSTVETQVLGWVLRNATSRSPAEYLSEKIWQPLGMEDDAEWLLDGPGGLPLAGVSLNARLRDYARFGLLMLNDGVLAGKKRILPERWVKRATTPGKPYLEQLDPQIFGYQYQWWVIPDGLVVPNGGGAFEAEGTQGQFLHIDPQHELVVAMTSHWPGPTGWDIPKAMAFHATVASIVRALGYE